MVDTGPANGDHHATDTAQQPGEHDDLASFPGLVAPEEPDVIQVSIAVQADHATVRVSRHDWLSGSKQEWQLLTERVPLPPGLDGRGAVAAVLQAVLELIPERPAP